MARHAQTGTSDQGDGRPTGSRSRPLTASSQAGKTPEPFRHLEARLAALAAAALFLPLPDLVSPGPGWLLAALVAVLLVPLVSMQEALRRPGGWQPRPRLVRLLALALLGLLAVAESGALALLLAQLPKVTEAKLLFRSATLIWLINLLVFSLAYWELDGGGPARRARGPDRSIDFAFPQQVNPEVGHGWKAEFLDYLFLAFNTGTAFSPTDTLVLSRRAKLLMMAQASISLLTIGLVVARGVNII